MFRFSATLAVAVVSFVTPCFGAMTITIAPDTALAANPAALGAFNRAANDWSSRFSNNITINISAGLSGTLNPGAIANANSVKFQAPFDFFRQKIVNAAAHEPDDAIVAHLPTLSQFNFTLPAGFTFGNKFVATKANFKALGYMDLIDLDALYGPIDATILFNSNVAFDYD
ncbi:MAG TPA: NF038122 family metalloprotease, partial [Tepidisphaeraceae bacterium]|nr:NF038122 family metalloprotease [Tepidisphaeraceae bacterium]